MAAKFNYIKLETLAPINLCALGVQGLRFIEFKGCKGQHFLNYLHVYRILIKQLYIILFPVVDCSPESQTIVKIAKIWLDIAKNKLISS
jgi:hypothetical protein